MSTACAGAGPVALHHPDIMRGRTGRIVAVGGGRGPGWAEREALEERAREMRARSSEQERASQLAHHPHPGRQTKSRAVALRVASLVVGIGGLGLALAVGLAHGKTYPPGLDCPRGPCYAIGHP